MRNEQARATEAEREAMEAVLADEAAVRRSRDAARLVLPAELAAEADAAAARAFEPWRGPR